MADLTVNSLSITPNASMPLEAGVGIIASEAGAEDEEPRLSTDAAFECPGAEDTFTGGTPEVVLDFS